MRRAIVISIVLHLMVLLSLLEFAAPGPSSAKRIGGKLSARIISPSPHDQPATAGDTGTGSRTRLAGEMQAKPQHPENRKRVDFDFGHFFRSTATSTSGIEKAAEQKSDLVGELEAEIGIEEERLFRLAVARSARQFKRYPDLARRRGWQGVAVITVALPPGLGAADVRLKSSSGYEVLDQQALEMVEGAISQAVMPEAIRGRRFQLDLPIEYRLED